MEENVHSYRPSDTSRSRGQPITLIAQFMQQARSMQHVDDVFLWLAQAMTYRLDIAIVQFLAIQRDSTGQFHIEARAVADQYSVLSPLQVGYVNQQVTTVARRVFQEQRGIPSGPVESIFPPPQAAMLAQYNLRCWAGYFLRNDAFLPPAKTERTTGKALVPLNMIVSFFTLYPLSLDQARAIHFILEQVVRIAVNRGLLVAPASSSPGKTANSGPNGDTLRAHARLVLLTPLYPPIKSPLLSFTLNSIRMLIYSCAFVRYSLLYLSKSTRFSMIMSLAFLVLIIGYGLNIPGIFQTQLAALTILAATVRICAYVSLLVAYSVG